MAIVIRQYIDIEMLIYVLMAMVKPMLTFVGIVSAIGIVVEQML